MGFPDSRLEMSLIGGFSHVLRYSEQVFYSLMGKLGSRRLHLSKKKLRHLTVRVFCVRFVTVAVHKHQTEIELVLACVGELNTILRNNVHWPLLYGAGNTQLLFFTNLRFSVLEESTALFL